MVILIARWLYNTIIAESKVSFATPGFITFFSAFAFSLADYANIKETKNK